MAGKAKRMCGLTVHAFVKYTRSEFRRSEAHPCYL